MVALCTPGLTTVSCGFACWGALIVTRGGYKYPCPEDVMLMPFTAPVIEFTDKEAAASEPFGSNVTPVIVPLPLRTNDAFAWKPPDARPPIKTTFGRFATEYPEPPLLI